MLQNWNSCTCEHHLNSPTLKIGENAFVVNLYRFSLSKNKWNKKGPVILYIHNNRMIANYIFGDKIVALNFQVYEHLANYAKMDSIQRKFVFSSMGFNSNLTADVMSI
jgi:hypothetical protein